MALPFKAGHGSAATSELKSLWFLIRPWFVPFGACIQSSDIFFLEYLFIFEKSILRFLVCKFFLTFCTSACQLSSSYFIIFFVKTIRWFLSVRKCFIYLISLKSSEWTNVHLIGLYAICGKV